MLLMLQLNRLDVSGVDISNNLDVTDVTIRNKLDVSGVDISNNLNVTDVTIRNRLDVSELIFLII